MVVFVALVVVVIEVTVMVVLVPVVLEIVVNVLLVTVPVEVVVVVSVTVDDITVPVVLVLERVVGMHVPHKIKQVSLANLPSLPATLHNVASSCSQSIKSGNPLQRPVVVVVVVPVVDVAVVVLVEQLWHKTGQSMM